MAHTHAHHHDATHEVHGAAKDGGARAAALLRQAGCRPTPQRLLVLQALAAGDHVTAEEILDAVRSGYPSINTSTVYRTLEALAAAGLVRQTDLGTGRLHFELARGHRHHHVVCQSCGEVTHLHDDVLQPLAASLAGATGYALTPDREVVLPGLCPGCRPTTPSPGEQAHAHS